MKLSRGAYVPANWLKYLSQILVDAAFGRKKRVICEAPPRHGKSALIARWLAVWYLELFPHKRIGILTYGSNLAEQHGAWIRDTILENEEYLTVRLKRDKRRVNYIETLEGGYMDAVGLDGAVTGKGWDLLIIDDPIKDEEQAASLSEREALWTKWMDRIRTRIEPGGSCVIMHTRWNVDDFIGRLLLPENQTEEEWQWEEIRFPAIADHEEGFDALGRAPGDALWPERWTADYILSLRTGNEYGWQALYQQNPYVKNGGYFNPQWFEEVPLAPYGAKWLRFWDLASTQKTRKQLDPDYTVGLLLGLHDGIYYVADIVRVRANPDEVERIIRETARIDGALVAQWFEQEPGSAGKFVINNMARKVLPTHKVKGFRSTGPKEVYADTAANRAENGRVKLVTRGQYQWNTREFLAELQGFPRWTHDDQVDGLSKGIAAFEKKVGWGVVKDESAA